ncbi:hypothetical protein [Micromonospora sp. NPDC049102]|uniref:hypothetical protein n=1 Tax=Micromonospora sp. NPDC049102 TaxID=3364265 RepID=UPI003719D32C
MTDRPAIRSSLPGPPAEPPETLAGRGPAAGRTTEPAAVEFPLVAALARGVALVLVLPVRLLWELFAAAGRLVHRHRHLLSPAGRFLRDWLVAPLVWALHRLLWRPLLWCAHHLLWRPPRWMARNLVWWLVVRFVRLVVAALVGAWRAAGWLLRWVYRLLLPPVGPGLRWLWRHTVRPLLSGIRWVLSVTVVPVARGLRSVWRATVTPAARWTRRAVLDPARVVSREVLGALGLRR